MDADVYKIGWSSNHPTVRGEQLSAATGVPLACIVVESWKVAPAKPIETVVHNALAAYRINPKREFFKASFDKIRAEIAGILKSRETIH